MRDIIPTFEAPRDETAFVVVLYVNRSGSTLFSRLLSEKFPDVCVFPELSFPMRLLVEQSRGRFVAGSALYELVSADPRHESLRIKASDLLDVCSAHSSADMPALFNSLAAASRHGRSHRAVMFKLETLLDVAGPLLATFPGIRLIHVVRDPRAVANSMLRTPVPEKPGFNMARGSVVYAARHWRDYIKRVDALSRIAPVMTVKYESLGANFPQVAADLEPFLGAGMIHHGGQSMINSYATAAIDSELHRNIHKPFIDDRVAGWSDELSPRDIDVIEAICREEMIRLGYEPSGSATTRGSMAMSLANARHVVATIRHGALTMGHYMRRKDALQALAHRARQAVVKRISRNRTS